MRELQSLQEAKSDLSNANKKLEQRFEIELRQKTQAQQEEEQASTERIGELEEIVKELEETNE